jgi:ankyrin repeat protein
MEKQLEILDFLIQQEGVDVMAPANNKNVSLHYLVRHQFDDQEQILCDKIIQHMIKRGVAIDAQNDMRETPLFQSCLRGTIFSLLFKIIQGTDRTVTLLRTLGADPNLINSFGEAGLHYACRRGDLSIVKALVNSGVIEVDLSITGKEGDALQIAHYFKNISIIAFLHGLKEDVAI